MESNWELVKEEVKKSIHKGLARWCKKVVIVDFEPNSMMDPRNLGSPEKCNQHGSRN